MKKPIRKAVLPVAGLGTRFLPATKAIPKEMLTVVDRPAWLGRERLQTEFGKVDCIVDIIGAERLYCHRSGSLRLEEI